MKDVQEGERKSVIFLGHEFLGGKIFADERTRTVHTCVYVRRRQKEAKDGQVLG